MTGPDPSAALGVGPIRIANASGFYGDRFDALHEMVTGGEIDVVTGDYLAELTMLILGRDRAKDPATGYAKTFLRQLEGSLGPALELGVRIVTNAGGLNPAGLADAIRGLTKRLGLQASVAHVEGDDLRARVDELGLQRLPATAMGPPLMRSPLAANAYLGATGIAACLTAGADIVVTGRVTDASLVLGPAAARFGWRLSDPGALDALAGAVVAGHLIECGAQVSGGNYAFFTDLLAAGADLRRPGFPIAEVYADGSSVITKHPGTGGAVTVGTVTAQLLYEVAGPRYLGPDVVARLDTVRLEPDGADRVRVHGVRGEPAPSTLKVGLNGLGGLRNEVTFVLTGLDVEAKAALASEQLHDALAARPCGAPKEMVWTLVRSDRDDADTEEAASAFLRCAVKDDDAARVGRSFSAAAVELALAGYPGFHLTAPPGDASPFGVFTAAYVDAALVDHIAVLPDGSRITMARPAGKHVAAQQVSESSTLPALPGENDLPNLPSLPPGCTPGDPTRVVPLGHVVGARSGDKGGDANLGVWARTPAVWPWLAHTLTADRLRELLPETAGLTVTRYLLPHLHAVNFVIEGLLGQGVAAQHRFDPQAKALGEWLRARHIAVPEVLL